MTSREQIRQFSRQNNRMIFSNCPYIIKPFTQLFAPPPVYGLGHGAVPCPSLLFPPPSSVPSSICVEWSDTYQKEETIGLFDRFRDQKY